MNKTFLISLLLLSYTLCFAQNDTPDTLTIETKTVRIIKLDWGGRLNIGVSKFAYGIKTSEWLGNHYAGDLNLGIFYNQLRLGFGFKLSTVNPGTELEFNGDTLTTFAKLNPIKFEITVGYNFQDLQFVTLEPYIGYLINSFIVINEDILQQKYDIPTQGGFTIGLSVYKELFKINPYEDFQIYFNTNYNLVDFSKVNSTLDNNFYSFELGISFQGWLTRTEIVD